MLFHLRHLVGLAGTLGLLAACHAEASIKASTDDSPHDRGNDPAVTSPTPAPVTAPVVASVPTDACPLFCYEARGSVRGEVTTDEAAQLRSSLEPVLGRMRQCTSPEDWRRHGSPTINLRIAPDGTLAELGVDPHHGHANNCFDDVGRGTSAQLNLPGRKVVRCAERCVSPNRGRRNARQQQQ